MFGHPKRYWISAWGPPIILGGLGATFLWVAWDSRQMDSFIGALAFLWGGYLTTYSLMRIPRTLEVSDGELSATFYTGLRWQSRLDKLVRAERISLGRLGPAIDALRLIDAKGREVVLTRDMMRLDDLIDAYEREAGLPVTNAVPTEWERRVRGMRGGW